MPITADVRNRAAARESKDKMFMKEFLEMLAAILRTIDGASDECIYLAAELLSAAGVLLRSFSKLSEKGKKELTVWADNHDGRAISQETTAELVKLGIIGKDAAISPYMKQILVLFFKTDTSAKEAA